MHENEANTANYHLHSAKYLASVFQHPMAQLQQQPGAAMEMDLMNFD